MKVFYPVIGFIVVLALIHEGKAKTKKSRDAVDCTSLRQKCDRGKAKSCKILETSCRGKQPIAVRQTGNNQCPRSCNGQARNKVCGTDGNTYANECMLRKQACKTASNSLLVDYVGKCTRGAPVGRNFIITEEDVETLYPGSTGKRVEGEGTRPRRPNRRGQQDEEAEQPESEEPESEQTESEEPESEQTESEQLESEEPESEEPESEVPQSEEPDSAQSETEEPESEEFESEEPESEEFESEQPESETVESENQSPVWQQHGNNQEPTEEFEQTEQESETMPNRRSQRGYGRGYGKRGHGRVQYGNKKKNSHRGQSGVRGQRHQQEEEDD